VLRVAAISDAHQMPQIVQDRRDTQQRKMRRTGGALLVHREGGNDELVHFAEESAARARPRRHCVAALSGNFPAQACEGGICDSVA